MKLEEELQGSAGGSVERTAGAYAFLRLPLAPLLDTRPRSLMQQLLIGNTLNDGMQWSTDLTRDRQNSRWNYLQWILVSLQALVRIRRCFDDRVDYGEMPMHASTSKKNAFVQGLT